MIEQLDVIAGQAVAVLYQALPPPLLGGLRKEAKPGGYSDAGADIAWSLRQAGVAVVTPTADPDPARDHDWVFPDDAAGIAAARARGATLLWANTVLFDGHPIETALSDCWIVGQSPSALQAADDKFATNRQLRAAGLPVVAALLAAHDRRAGAVALGDVDEEALAHAGLRLPLVVKPVRGRGSQGVTVAADIVELRRAAAKLIDGGRFGDLAMIEQYLPGEEITITLMPAHGDPRRAWDLPAVRRFDQRNGVAPWNGDVPVVRNSVALTADEERDPEVRRIAAACLAAYRLGGSRTLARIDCRRGGDGAFMMFDVNLKPNLTGAGRPGRDEQDSLCALAARAIGWSYADMLRELLRAAWREA